MNCRCAFEKKDDIFSVGDFIGHEGSVLMTKHEDLSYGENKQNKPRKLRKVREEKKQKWNLCTVLAIGKVHLKLELSNFSQSIPYLSHDSGAGKELYYLPLDLLGATFMIGARIVLCLKHK